MTKSEKSEVGKASDEQILNWLRLYRCQNVGPVTFKDLLGHFGSAAVALDALPDLARRGGRASKIKLCTQEQALQEIEAAESIGAKYILNWEQGFPQWLKNSDSSPPILCVKGEITSFARPIISIVGSRNASATGMRLAEQLAGNLGAMNYTIASGLARGIDTAAHKASLHSGTVAVLAGGLDKIYPSENSGLAEDIVASGGALLSEMPIGWQAGARDFPKRNRIVAGLAIGVVIVEAAQRSGSLITARLAGEMGRHVLAVPGSPLDPRSDGSNRLIREGATLVRSAEDIAEAAAPSQLELSSDKHQAQISLNATPKSNFQEAGDEPQQNLRDAISNLLTTTPTEIDDLVRFTDASIGQVQIVLLELSLAGKLEKHAGNRVSLLG
jgi:DNA processing protein